jgi:hypothetical protein
LAYHLPGLKSACALLCLAARWCHTTAWAPSLGASVPSLCTRLAALRSRVALIDGHPDRLWGRRSARSSRPSDAQKFRALQLVHGGIYVHTSGTKLDDG